MANHFEQQPKTPPPSRGPEPTQGGPLQHQPSPTPEFGAATQAGAARLPLSPTMTPPPDARIGFRLPSDAADVPGPRMATGPTDEPSRPDTNDTGIGSTIQPSVPHANYGYQGGDPRITEPIMKQAQQAATNAVHDLYEQAVIVRSSEPTWQTDDPKHVVDRFIDAIPDTLPRITANAVELAPRNQPSDLELYFLSRLNELPSLQDEDPEGSISVRDTLLYLRDGIRTKRFVKSIGEEVTRLDPLREEEIQVVDAGCGPIPLMGIYAALSSEKVKVTALELNPNSARIARNIVDALGLQDRVQVIEADATTYQPTRPVDLLVSETLHTGLSEEPIVQIMTNLAPHVPQDGTILPSSVTIKAALVPVDKLRRPEGGYVAVWGVPQPLIRPEWHDVLTYKPGDPLTEIAFTLPKDATGDHVVVITNSVAVGQQPAIQPYESFFSVPNILRGESGPTQIFHISSNNQGVDVQYQPGDYTYGVATLR